ncbi:MAG TPA: hypothetical protein PLG09_10120 [Syntrophomonadaceae bacterium]|jgi:hypothetical protein|nr:hypothetical protein [Syntrophomonadaceae bacterium]HOQ10467.1 hypothetical protein [Syntrophomonadaceae bacterium]HPU49616.1 hypothetical protein [Syntrophomonadaceae bacterium]
MHKTPVILLSRLATLLCWAAALYLIAVHHFWYLLLAILLLHAGELVWTGYRRGIKAGYSGIYSVFMTLLWGFTWWLYLDIPTTAGSTGRGENHES